MKTCIVAALLVMTVALSQGQKTYNFCVPDACPKYTNACAGSCADGMVSCCVTVSAADMRDMEAFIKNMGNQ